MTKACASEIEEGNKILAAIDVQWVGYQPAGGDMAHTILINEVMPLLRVDREEAEQTKQAIADRLRKINRTTELAEKIATCGKELADVVSGLAAVEEDKNDLLCRIDGILSGARSVLNFASSLKKVDAELAKTKDIDEDIKFFDAFDSYISVDAVLDKLLFVMPLAPQKYRAKILRTCLRLATLISASQATIQNSQSVVYKLIQDKVSPILKTLDMAYAYTIPILKKLKKEYAKKGNDALIHSPMWPIRKKKND